MKKIATACLLAALSTVASLGVNAQIPPPPDGRILSSEYTGKVYSPYAERDFATDVYFGDTHLHTDMSMDAGAFGNRLGLDEAYKFARGEQVTSTNAGPVRLSRPLDFLVVADHSDNMGFFPDLFAGAPNILADPTGKNWYDRVKAGEGVGVALEIIGLVSQGKFPAALMYTPDSKPYRNAWDKTVAAAERYNDPGKFTAFIGYEWTSLVRGNNLHRVVVYRDGGDKGGQMVPYTMTPPLGSTNPRDLWQWLANYEKKTGGKVLAIRPQRQPVQWHHVPHEGTVRRQTAGCRLRHPARPAGNPCTRPPRSRATAKPIPSCPPMTNLPTTRPGTSATSTCRRPRPTPCWRENTPGRPSSAAWNWRRNWAPTPTSSA